MERYQLRLGETPVGITLYTLDEYEASGGIYADEGNAGEAVDRADFVCAATVQVGAYTGSPNDILEEVGLALNSDDYWYDSVASFYLLRRWPEGLCREREVYDYMLNESQTDRISFDEHVQTYARDAFGALAATGESLELTDEMLESHRESFVDGLAVDDMEEAIARFDDAFRRTWADELEDHIGAAERTFPIDGGEHIDLLADGSFTAYSLTTGGGDIIYIGSYHDAETETDRAAELHVTLEESVEDLLPGWRQATGEEISAACAGSWVERHIYPKEYDVFEDNAGGIYLFIHSDDGIEYSFEYTGTLTGQLRDDLAELHRTGTTSDWDHEFCLPEPEQTLATLRAWVDEGTGGAKLIADQDGVYLDRAGVAGRLALGDELFTVAEAAEALELSEPRIRTLCQDGRMGKKVGRDWVISAEDIEAMKDRPGPGRPRKMAE